MKHSEDLELVREILNGSVDAWHGFILTYARLMHAVLNRHLRDADEAHSALTDLLSKLKMGGLTSYQGRSSLSTWLVSVARHAAIDRLRALRGRREFPAMLTNLPEAEHLAFRLFYMEGRSRDEVRSTLRRRGLLPHDRPLSSVLARLDEALDPRTLARLEWERAASGMPVPSGRLLEYMIVAREEAARRAEDFAPDAGLRVQEIERTLARVREIMNELPSQQRLALEYKYEKGWTADRIAAELGLEKRREAYGLVEKAIRYLRRRLGIAASLLLLVVALVGLVAGMRGESPSNRVRAPSQEVHGGDS